MELRVLGATGVPADSLLSVRVGSAQQHGLLHAAEQPYRFPRACGEGHVQVDVYVKLATARLLVAPGGTRCHVPLERLVDGDSAGCLGGTSGEEWSLEVELIDDAGAAVRKLGAEQDAAVGKPQGRDPGPPASHAVADSARQPRSVRSAITSISESVASLGPGAPGAGGWAAGPQPVGTWSLRPEGGGDGGSGSCFASSHQSSVSELPTLLSPKQPAEPLAFAAPAASLPKTSHGAPRLGGSGRPGGPGGRLGGAQEQPRLQQGALRHRGTHPGAAPSSAPPQESSEASAAGARLRPLIAGPLESEPPELGRGPGLRGSDLCSAAGAPCPEPAETLDVTLSPLNEITFESSFARMAPAPESGRGGALLRQDLDQGSRIRGSGRAPPRPAAGREAQRGSVDVLRGEVSSLKAKTEHLEELVELLARESKFLRRVRAGAGGPRPEP